ncbi:MAG: glycosyltransferase family 2 protein [Halobacteriaceae archaeon]
MTERPVTSGDRERTFEAVPVTDAVAAGDAQAPVDPRSVLADATVVVPTNREHNYTVESLPDWVDREVRTDDGLNVARNRGVEAADGDWIVLVDDDVTFPTRLTAVLLDGMHERHLVGAEDFWPLDYVIGRYMVFHRSLWAAAGGFDESRPHGGDTDFAVRCVKAGASLCRIPRRLVPHHDPTSGFSTAQHLEWLAYLSRRHPRVGLPAAARLGLARLGLLSPRPEYPADWEGRAFRSPDEDHAGDDADGRVAGDGVTE